MPVTAKNFIDTFTDSPNSHNKQGLAFLPPSHEDIEAQKKLNILAKAAAGRTKAQLQVSLAPRPMLSALPGTATAM